MESIQYFGTKNNVLHLYRYCNMKSTYSWLTTSSFSILSLTDGSSESFRDRDAPRVRFGRGRLWVLNTVFCGDTKVDPWTGERGDMGDRLWYRWSLIGPGNDTHNDILTGRWTPALGRGETWGRGCGIASLSPTLERMQTLKYHIRDIYELEFK